MGHPENADPHIWLSPANVKIIARNILDALVTKVPFGFGCFQAKLPELSLGN